MRKDTTEKKDYKNWDTKKEQTPEDKFNKLFNDFKTDVVKSGILRDIKDHRYYIKPSQKRRIALAEAKMKAKQNHKRRTSGNY